MRAVVSPSRGNTSILQFLLSRQVSSYTITLSLGNQNTLFHFINSIQSKRILKVEMNWVRIGVNRVFQINIVFYTRSACDLVCIASYTLVSASSLRSNKQLQLKQIKRANSRHVLHNLIRKAGRMNRLPKDCFARIHLVLQDSPQTHRQIERILIHQPPEKSSLESHIYHD